MPLTNYKKSIGVELARLASVKVHIDTLNQYSVFMGDKMLREDSAGRVICCSGLRNSGTRGATHVVMRLMPYVKEVQTVVNEPYLDWLLMRSPFASYYSEDNFNVVMKQGGLAVRCDVPANLMMVALLMFRYIWEFPNVVRDWEQLVNVGVDPDSAFVLAHLLGKGCIGQEAYGNRNHFVFYPTFMGLATLKDFKSLGDIKVEGLFTSTGHYSFIQNTWGSHEKKLSSFLMESCKSEERVVKHAFGSSTVGTSKNMYEQVRDAVNKLEEL